jgi:hypothetical protein
MRNNSIRYFVAYLLTIYIGLGNAIAQECYPLQPKTAAFATQGTSPYKDDVLWLTWGSTLSNIAANPYGQHNQSIVNGSGSYASVDLGGGKIMCIEAVVRDMGSGQTLRSYAPGNYGGDSLDDLYNIGGTGGNNRLVSGMRNQNDGATTTFTLRCKATLNGQPIKLFGVVIADAESLASGENFSSTAYGIWDIVELRKNIGAGSYNVRKNNLNGTNAGKQRITFASGNDNNTAAIAYCAFSEDAYQGSEYYVDVEVSLKGGGLTAIALGLLLPGLDGGDAPESYGTPVHMLDKKSIGADNISDQSNNGTNNTDLNTSSYTPGALNNPTYNHYLGTAVPDLDSDFFHDFSAKGDDNNNTIDEDAWPTSLQNVSYETYSNYDEIIATIRFRSRSTRAYIGAWIDFNVNGIFEPEEFTRANVTASNSTTRTVNLTWVVPANIEYRSTYVRLRISPNEADILSPTGIAFGGEIEDHKIVIPSRALVNPSLRFRAKTLPY